MSRSFTDLFSNTANVDELKVTKSTTVTGTATCGSIVKFGGTPLEFLKADGSVDVNRYLTVTEGDTLHAAVSACLPLAGGTLSGPLIVDATITCKSITTSGSASHFLKADGTADTSEYMNVEQAVPIPLSGETFRGFAVAYNASNWTSVPGMTVSLGVSSIVVPCPVNTSTITTSSYVSRVPRLLIKPKAPAAGKVTWVYGFRGTSALDGGVFTGNRTRFIIEFGVADTAKAPGCRQFYGLCPIPTPVATSSPAYSNSTPVASLINIFGIGSDDKDTNLQLFVNGASPVAYKKDMGSLFPSIAPSTTMYIFQAYLYPNFSIGYSLSNVGTGATISGVVVPEPTVTLPLPTTNLGIIASRCVGTGPNLANSGTFTLRRFGISD